MLFTFWGHFSFEVRFFFFSDQHPGVSQPHYVLKKKFKKKISTAHFCQFNASAVRSYLKVMKFSVIFT